MKRLKVEWTREDRAARLARTRKQRRAVTALVAEAKRQPDPLRWLAKQVIESQDPDWGP